jgi:ribose 5-phosphate isomerase A
LSWVEDAKRKAALKAILPIRSGWVIGLGSGSTTAYALAEIARLVKTMKFELSVVPTSHQIENLAISHGLRIRTINEVHSVDYAIDGADQVEIGSLNVVKGGGGAMLREKIVDSAARKLAIVVDERKLTQHLGEKQSIPLEVLPFAHKSVQVKITNMGGRARLRESTEKAGPVITDNGNFILDADFGLIKHATQLDRGLKMLPGLLETGLFLNMADYVYVGRKDGKVEVPQ